MGVFKAIFLYLKCLEQWNEREPEGGGGGGKREHTKKKKKKKIEK